MASLQLQTSPSIHRESFQVRFQKIRKYPCRRSEISCIFRAEYVLAPSTDGCRRRQALTIGTIASWAFLNRTLTSFAAENDKGFLSVSDKIKGYSFLYPFGWQEIVIEGQDRVFKDIIEPLESVSVSTIPTNKQDIRELGPPQEVAEALIKRVLAPPSQKAKLIEAAEHDDDGKAYYTFEFVAQASNYTRHALSTISIGNGKFYALTTGANERRWGKMKDQLHRVAESFKILKV